MIPKYHEKKNSALFNEELRQSLNVQKELMGLKLLN